MNTDQNRVFLAVVLSGLVLIAWQFLYAPKFDANSLPASTSTSVATSSAEQATNKAIDNSQPIAPTTVDVNQQRFELNFNDSKVVISSSGGILEVVDPNTVYNFDNVLGDKYTMRMVATSSRGERVVNFNSSSFDESSKIWLLKDESAGITLSVSRDVNYFNFNIFTDVPTKFSFFYQTPEQTSENGKTRDYIYFKEKPVRVPVGDDNIDEGKLRWFGLDYHYHLFALISDVQLYTAKFQEDGLARFSMLNESTTHNFKLVFLKKNYDLLASVGENIDQSVDFGIFGIVAVPILRMLQYFYKYFPNYGIAIILLTIIIRLLTFPLQFKSFKSMKKMQNIQPEITKLREKFKDDPQRMQKETMDLFKRTGANPLGGCFPMLLQMPIFIAFYQVLSNSVELVGAPFYFWLNDLSLKDPFYVLPVLMGIVMFLQSKLNPTPMTDPMQKKMMMFMPVIFTFIMKDLPSGLNLYMTFSILLGIGQQLLVYKLSD